MQQTYERITMSMNLPNIPDELVGKEPSLIELEYFTRDSSELFQEQDLEVISVYMETTKSTYSSGQYYLFGQILTRPIEPITNAKLQGAIDANKQRLIDYGGPCNGFEAASIAVSDRQFRNLITILDRYYEIKLEIEWVVLARGVQQMHSITEIVLNQKRGRECSCLNEYDELISNSAPVKFFGGLGFLPYDNSLHKLAGESLQNVIEPCSNPIRYTFGTNSNGYRSFEFYKNKEGTVYLVSRYIGKLEFYCVVDNDIRSHLLSQ